MKKVKAVPDCAASNDAPEEYLNPVQPKVKRRVRTSAAMIGLAISMGASNLLLTRHSDRTTAAEPADKEPVIGTMSAADGSVSNDREKLIEPEAGTTLPLNASLFTVNRILPRTPPFRLQPITPTPFSHRWKDNQVGVGATIAPFSQLDGSTSTKPARAATVSSDLQAEKLVRSRRTSQLLQKLKARQQVRMAQVEPVNSDQTSPAITMSQLPRLIAAVTEQGEASLALSSGQRALIDRLKQAQAPNNLRDKLVAWKQQNTANSQQQMLERLGNLQQTGETHLTPTAVFVVPEVATATTNELQTVAARTILDYQVKAGDTLTAIAKQHGLPIAELVKANDLTNPNRIQINQRLKIPDSQTTVALQVNPAAMAFPANVSAGIGGNFSEDDSVIPTIADAKSPTLLSPSLAARSPQPPNSSVQGLRADIEKLRQKYDGQKLAGQFVPPVNETGSLLAFQVPPLSTVATFAAAASSQISSNLPVEQPINPEFRAAQVPTNLKPAQEEPQVTPKDAAPPRLKPRVATASVGLDANESLESLRGRQVSPELPPLGAADTYLPRPTAGFKNYIWPTMGKLTSGYGWRWGRMHKGIDIAAPVGTPVVAAAAGVVVKAGWNPGGYGKLVDIRHADGTLTRYAHNNKILVQAGQLVQQGQQISEMGSTGFSTGPHLHFEVHKMGKKAVDPIAYLPGK